MSVPFKSSIVNRQSSIDRGGSVIRFLVLFHLVGMVLSFGGMMCQLIVLAKHHNSGNVIERVGAERMADAIVALVQTPGVYLSLVTGAALAWTSGSEPLYQGWLHFKLLFVFWIFLGTRLMARNLKNIRALRTQCGDNDSERLQSLKNNHRMMGYVTVVAFLFVIILSLWKPF